MGLISRGQTETLGAITTRSLVWTRLHWQMKALCFELKLQQAKFRPNISDRDAGLRASLQIAASGCSMLRSGLDKAVKRWVDQSYGVDSRETHIGVVRLDQILIHTDCGIRSIR
ncbi:hypothetical protein CEXT_506001 [Caerostris extrusa]|uniref:Uncharacterized protein n=1 Tax=Caerostris extrusa TaxID=172846 RepID=A0AAV4MA98_CAEEX|nr:hypothetical protein CEXT_506001 [Caerostris extrusa]